MASTLLFLYNFEVLWSIICVCSMASPIIVHVHYFGLIASTYWASNLNHNKRARTQEMCTWSLLALQVQALSPDAQWSDVVIPPDCVALLPGYTLEYALAGLVPATQHRVVRALYWVQQVPFRV